MDAGTRIRRGVRRAMDRALAPRGLRIAGVEDVADTFRLADFTPELQALWATVRPFTLTSPERVACLVAVVEYVVRHEIPGAFVECGVFRGGSSMAAAMTFGRLGELRDLHLFDTFEGMPEPGPGDVDFRGVPATRWWDRDHQRRAFIEQEATRTDVERRMAATGYPARHVHLVPGLVEDTLPREAPDRVAILRLDTDFYGSTRHELEQLWPRVAPGGFVLIDDYGHFEGARRAADEFFAPDGPWRAAPPAGAGVAPAASRVPPFLHRIDYSGRLIIKP